KWPRRKYGRVTLRPVPVAEECVERYGVNQSKITRRYVVGNFLPSLAALRMRLFGSFTSSISRFLAFSRVMMLMKRLTILALHSLWRQGSRCLASFWTVPGQNRTDVISGICFASISRKHWLYSLGLSGCSGKPQYP